MKILIVDDSPEIRRLLRRSLAEIAHEIWERDDGSVALDAYQTHHPDVVLMDIRMTEVDGLAATRSICSYDPSARIIVVTDYDDDDLRAAAFEAGATGYVLKQNISELMSIISAPIF